MSKLFVHIFIECFFSPSSKYFHLVAPLTCSYCCKNNWAYSDLQQRHVWVGGCHSKHTHTPPKKKRNWGQDGIATWWKRIEGKEEERKTLLIVPGKKSEQVFHQGIKWMARGKKKKTIKRLSPFQSSGNANRDHSELLPYIHRMT